MHVRLDLVSPPAVPVVSTELARRQCRIDNDDEFLLLDLYVDVATKMVESYLNRALITQTLRYTISQTFPPISWPMVSGPLVVLPLSLTWGLLRSWMRAMELPRSTVQSITSVVSGAWETGDTTLVLGTDYEVDLKNDPCRIRIISNQSWGMTDHLQFTYVAGYGDSPADVPSPIQVAVMLLTAHLYENRGDSDMEGIPKAVYSLCDPYRMWTFPD